MKAIARGSAISIIVGVAILGLPGGVASQEKVGAVQELQKLKPSLPRDLVYLSEIDPTIREDMRYATPNNFTGARLPGYVRGACILRRAAALALKRVQADLMSRTPQISLKVYDCYRPKSAVTAMVRWSRRTTDPQLKNFYFPNIAKRKLFSSGYISSRSAHSTGSTVDLSIVNVSREAISEAAITKDADKNCVDSGLDATDPMSIDMGTAYDCFDVKSHTWSKGLTVDQIGNRKLLVQVMARHGFANYRREWWHFTHRPSRTKRRFNVPIH